MESSPYATSFHRMCHYTPSPPSPPPIRLTLCHTACNRMKDAIPLVRIVLYISSAISDCYCGDLSSTNLDCDRLWFADSKTNPHNFCPSLIQELTHNLSPFRCVFGRSRRATLHHTVSHSLTIETTPRLALRTPNEIRFTKEICFDRKVMATLDSSTVS